MRRRRHLTGREMMVELVDAAINEDAIHPKVPTGRREELIDFLTRAMVSRPVLEYYIVLQEAEARRREVYDRLPGVEVEFSVEDVARDGLAVLSDEQLAYLALDRSGLTLLESFLNDLYLAGRCGAVWHAAHERESLRLFGDPAHLGALLPDSASPLATPDTGTPHSAPAPKPRAVGSWKRAGWIGAGVAAGVFFSLVALNPLLDFRQDFTASTHPHYLAQRGEEVPQPTVTSPIKGFVTVISVSSSGQLTVWPAEGMLAAAPFPIEKGETKSIGPLPKGTVAALAVVTEQPATGEILREAANFRVAPTQMPELESRIRSHLRSSNYGRLAFGTVTFDSR